MSTQSLEELININVLSEFEIINFPCHTQSVERIEKFVIESCTKICGKESKDGFIRTTLLSRSTMPSFDYKHQSKPMSNTPEES